MKKTSKYVVLLFIGIAALVLCLFYLEPARAQNNTSHADSSQIAFSQQSDKLNKVPEMIRDSKSAGANFERRPLFQSGLKVIDGEAQLHEVLSNGVILDLNRPAIEISQREDLGFLILPLPDGKGGTIELELVKVNIFAPGFSVKTSEPTSEPIDENLGIHYRGIVKGDDRSLAAISIFKNEVMGFYSTEADGNSILGRLGGDNPNDLHVLYAEKDLKVRSNFSCDTEDTGVTLPESILQTPAAVAARCVRIYIEANFDLFQNKGSVANTTSYLTGMFNQSATLFSNDGIPVSLSEVFVWTSTSPYNGATSDAVLIQFRNLRTSFNGDLAHLITLNRQFGGLAYVDTLCNSGLRYGLSDIDPTFDNVPMYSWTVYVFTHETGHNLGSRHTHACVWNGNGTAIDGCGPSANPVPGFPPITYEGTCSGAPIPTNGGTIMSYCHLPPNPGIIFALGFGTQPRNLILNRFNAVSCLSNCSTGGLPNDNCSSAILLTSNSACSYTLGTVLNATASGLPKPSCDNFASPNMYDVWYKFTATTSSHVVTVDPSTVIGDPVVSVYSSCTGSQIGCSDGDEGVTENLSLSGLTVGNTYYVRVYDYGNIEPTGSNADFQICVTGTIVTPTITVSTTSLSGFGSVAVGQNSAPQSYTVSGSNLSANISIQAPTGFQISLSSTSGFTNTLTLTRSGGSVPTTTIFARFSPQASGAQTGNISHTSSGATARNVSVGGTGTGGGTVQFSSATYSVNENGGSRTITLTRTGGTNAFVVNYGTSNGTATAGADYTGLNEVMSFATNETSKTFNIPIIDDTLVEGNETVNLNLSNPSGGVTLGSPSTAVLTIVDNDTAQNYMIAVSASPSAGGTVSGGGTFPAGSSRTVTATANTNYTFINWTENSIVVSPLANYNFTLNGNRNLVANFTTAGSLSNRLFNPGFENGPVFWNNYSSGGYQDITNSAPIAAHSGNWLAWLGDADNLTEHIYQDVAIPADATQAFVQFWYLITTSDAPSFCFDSLSVEIRRPSDNALLATLATLCNYNQTTQWTLSNQLNVLGFRGQTIRLRFIALTDVTEPSGFFLDDISVLADGTTPQRFLDVPPTHPYYAYIERIAQRGVTAGCGGGNYCPNGLVSREEMSTFLERAIGVVNVPTPTGQTFIDVPPSRWSYAFVEDFFKRGLTAGCGGSMFCPAGLVSREQMATFMIRALGHNPGTPASQRFVDVDPTRWSYAFVDDFVLYGTPRGIMNEIKNGCNSDGLHFCPDKPLTRAEMAAWLVITFGW